MRSKRSVGEKLLSWPDLVLLVFFVAFLALALAGSLSPADGTSTVGAAFMPPSAEHPLGTDGLAAMFWRASCTAARTLSPLPLFPPPSPLPWAWLSGSP